MRRLTLQATDDNVLETIKANTFNRNSDIRDFIESLDSIEGNMFISLDARWGEGKTFYVRQIEKALEYLTKKNWEEKEDDDGKKYFELLPYFNNTILDSIELSQSYLPIYYNAWLYDNHNDPLMSLIFEIVKKAEVYYSTKLPKSLGEGIAELISSIAIGNSYLSFSGRGVVDAIKGTDILNSVKIAEQIREIVRNILNEAIIEKANRLVIFIDELDRCRPNYAIEMLERIKHYFDDERIIFVVSVNKEQLVHTISNCYGYGFDSTGYLNKFFDLNVHLPFLTEKHKKGSYIIVHSTQQFLLANVVNGLIDYYKLSLRDALIFRQRIGALDEMAVNDNSIQGQSMSLFIPIVAVLDIKDQDEKNKFINGDSQVLDEVCRNVPLVKDMIIRFSSGSDDVAFEATLQKFKKIYEHVFKDQNPEEREDIRGIAPEFKRCCIKLCNGFSE